MKRLLIGLSALVVMLASLNFYARDPHRTGDLIAATAERIEIEVSRRMLARSGFHPFVAQHYCSRDIVEHCRVIKFKGLSERAQANKPMVFEFEIEGILPCRYIEASIEGSAEQKKLSTVGPNWALLMNISAISKEDWMAIISLQESSVGQANSAMMRIVSWQCTDRRFQIFVSHS